jgi:hypothetical protein
MKMRRVAAFFAVGLFLVALNCGEAFALKIRCNVSPQHAERAGFVVIARSNENDTTTFLISRDLSKAKSLPADSDLTIRRAVTLEVSGDGSPVIRCRLEPRRERNALTYQFTLASNLVVHAHLSVREDQDYKSLAGKPQLMGFGMHYELALNEFVTENDVPGSKLKPPFSGRQEGRTFVDAELQKVLHDLHLSRFSERNRR